jgi:hypothetical protein
LFLVQFVPAGCLFGSPSIGPPGIIPSPVHELPVRNGTLCIFSCQRFFQDRVPVKFTSSLPPHRFTCDVFASSFVAFCPFVSVAGRLPSSSDSLPAFPVCKGFLWCMINYDMITFCRFVRPLYTRPRCVSFIHRSTKDVRGLGTSICWYSS